MTYRSGFLCFWQSSYIFNTHIQQNSLLFLHILSKILASFHFYFTVDIALYYIYCIALRKFQTSTFTHLQLEVKERERGWLEWDYMYKIELYMNVRYVMRYMVGLTCFVCGSVYLAHFGFILWVVELVDLWLCTRIKKR